MITCEYEPFAGRNCWWENEKEVWQKKDRVVVKSFDKDNKFQQSYIVPTNRYPLTGTYEVFKSDNTSLVTDEKIFSILDSLEYESGNFYGNAEAVTRALVEKGYKAVTYAGWFMMKGDTGVCPVHSAWTILEDENKKSVLDVSDTYKYMMEQFTANKEHPDKKKKEQEKLPVSKRMEPVGIPFLNAIYIGAPCNGGEGYVLYQALKSDYPEEMKEQEKNMVELTKDMIRRGMDYFKK